MGEVRRIGVAGAGTMGAGIAQVAAQAGLMVRLYDVEPAFVERGVGAIQTSLDRFVSRGRLSREDAEATIGRLLPTTSLDDFGDCDLVVEAAPERLELKRRVFGELDRICRPEAVLASNTSSLSITEIAAATSRPERVVGMHFFNPPVLLPLVEVARAALSSAATVATTVALARVMGKTPVEVADTPGFIVNRCARPFYLEALRMLGEGLADVPTIDRVLELGGFRMGPFRLMDLVGIDVNYAVTRSVYEQSFFDPRYRPHLIQQQMVRAGRFGRKTGQGFYEYPDHAAAGAGSGGPEAEAAEGSAEEPPTPIAVLGDGPLAESLRAMLVTAGRPLADDIERAGLVVVAGIGPLEVRRLGVRDALRGAADRATILAHCAPYTVTEIVSTLRRTERVVGFVLVGDPAAARVVEVAGGVRTADEAVEVGLAFFRSLGKAAVRVGDGPGMILLRVISALVNEAAAALDDRVASPDGIDTAMRLGVNYPLGPLEWGDQLGPDLVLHTMRTLQADYGDDRYRPAIRLRRAVQSATSLRRE